MQAVRERLPGILAASLLLAGCVSLTPEQRAKVDEIQSFADRTTRVYNLPGVRISIQSATNLNIGAMYRQGNIFVNVRMLDSPSLTKLIAHELGHYVLGHEPAASVSSQADWQRAQQQRELDANAKAVEILVRAKGMSQREAVQMVADALQRAQRAVDRGAPLTPGHLTPAEELADLRARFPESR
jgi:Zn-dependent peptidase ImmA (M78 family)